MLLTYCSLFRRNRQCPECALPPRSHYGAPVDQRRRIHASSPPAPSVIGRLSAPSEEAHFKSATAGDGNGAPGLGRPSHPHQCVTTMKSVSFPVSWLIP